MKKNLISILILALLVVNIVLTAIMMFSSASSVKKTNALVGDIASILSLELSDKSEEPEEGSEITIADLDSFDVGDELQIALRKNSEGKVEYCVVKVSIMMNTKHPDYETLKDTPAAKVSMLQDTIITVISSHTRAEIEEDTEAIKNEILARLQQEFDSTFIYKVVFSKLIFG